MKNGTQDRDVLRLRMEKYLCYCRVDELSVQHDKLRSSLTISRQCGTGLSRFSLRLLDYLDSVNNAGVSGWALMDQSSIGQLVEQGHFPARTAPFSPNRSIFPVSSTLERILSLPPDQWTLFNHSANTIRTLCRNGNVIIVGRAGNFITADLPNTFHVRLVGGTARRVASTADRYHIGEAEATELVEETDKARTRFVSRYTEADIDAAFNYHLVINTDNLPDDLVVRIIGDSLHEWESLRGNESDFPPLAVASTDSLAP